MVPDKVSLYHRQRSQHFVHEIGRQRRGESVGSTCDATIRFSIASLPLNNREFYVHFSYKYVFIV